MVPALKNKASLNSQMRKCVWTQITAYLKKNLWRQQDINALPAFAEETLQPRHILVS